MEEAQTARAGAAEAGGTAKGRVDARCLPSQTTTWLTPKWILDALGEFDLDPRCPPEMPWRTAKRMIHQPEDGLAAEWSGRVWLNPPYGRGIDKWMKKMAVHNCGVALVFARTETRWFREYILKMAAAVTFLDRRIRFCLPDGTPGGSPPVGSVLAFYGTCQQQGPMYTGENLSKLGNYVYLGPWM